MDPSEPLAAPATLAAPAAGHVPSGLIGATVALAAGLALLAVLAGFSPFGFDVSTLFDQPVFVAILVALSVALGWRLGGRATSGGWWRTVSGGLLFGVFWPPIAIVIIFTAAVVDSLARGVFAFSGIGSDIVWLLYGLAVFWAYGMVIFIPLGLLWALATRLAARLVERTHGSPISGGQGPTARLAVALLAISIGGGVGLTLGYAPWSTRCLTFPAGSATDAAFSPTGDLLAVALRTDKGDAGSVVLLSWPSGRTVATWAADPDLNVAVARDGRAYWSSNNYYESGAPILSAVAGSVPSVLTVSAENAVGDLTWTAAGLMGITGDGQFIVSVPLGSPSPSVVRRPAEGQLREFWVSSDGAITATEAWQSSSIEIAGPSGNVSVPIKGGAEGFALTSDLRTLVVAASAGGIRLVDVATGHSRTVMAGSQSFLAMSQRGDLAWTNAGEFGHSPLCTSTLAQLGGT